MKKALLIVPALILLEGCSTTPAISNTNTLPAVQTNLNEVSANTNVLAPTSTNINTAPITSTAQSKRTPTVLTPSSAAEEGHTWQQFNSDRLPVTFLYQASADTEKMSFVEKNNSLATSYPNYGENVFMEIAKKLPNESDIDALKRLYFSKLSTTELENCTISTEAYYSGDATGGNNKKGATRYEFIPKPGVTDKDEGPVEHCGDHGLTNAVRFFEFQNGKENFVFMELGQDPGWLDDKSLKILE